MSGEDKQHFIQLETIDDEEGHLYKVQLLSDHWIKPVADQPAEAETGHQTETSENPIPSLVVTEAHQPPSPLPDQPDGLFPTEVDESDITDAKYRLSNPFLSSSANIITQITLFLNPIRPVHRQASPALHNLPNDPLHTDI